MEIIIWVTFLICLAQGFRTSGTTRTVWTVNAVLVLVIALAWG